MSNQETDEILEALAREELNLSHQEEIQYKKSFQNISDLKSDIKINRSGNDVFKDLLGSVALEESAIANLIQAEARKIEAFTGMNGEFPTSPSNQQINDFQNAVARVLEALVENQKLLIRMVELSKRLLEQSGDD